MSYKRIIDNNCQKYHSWWPKFAFHYTDISNAINILKSGYLYSRNTANELQVMNNENANRQVIDMTNAEALSNVRFYFRPLTPTQYHNEGYKHRQIRYEEANVPIPIFFLFKLDKLLELRKLKFSTQSQSGYGAECFSGLREFEKLNFEQIYKSGKMENPEEEKKFRQAELMYPVKMEVSDDLLYVIICRNEVEKATLLNLLKEQDVDSFRKYKNRIKVNKVDLFQKNGLFITNCNYHNNVFNINFSDYAAKYKYAKDRAQKLEIDLNELEDIPVKFWFQWTNGSEIVNEFTTKVYINYLNPRPIIFNNRRTIKGAKYFQTKVYIEDKLMGFIGQPLEESILF